MEKKILRVDFFNIERFVDKKLRVDFIAEKRVLEEEHTENLITPINQYVNRLHTLAFLGINATGKTMTLKLISEILDIYFKNKSLDYHSDIVYYFKEWMKVEVYLYHQNTIYKQNP